MGNYDINGLPEKIKQNFITIDDASKLLMEELYIHPYRFGLARMDIDDRSDFIVKLFPRFPRLFKTYNSNTSPFGVYFYSYVTGALCSWHRQKIRQSYAQKSMYGTYVQLYEENEKLYEKNEASLNSIPDQNEAGICVAQRIPPFSPEQEKTPAFINAPQNFNWHEKNIYEKAVLILTLKSSFYLNDTEISKACKFSGCSPEVLGKTVRKLQLSLQTKADRRSAFKQKRDNAYYFHRKYMLELLQTSPYSKRYTPLLLKYRKHTTCWQTKNVLLQKNRYRVCPTNRVIARILGICERQVSFT